MTEFGRKRLCLKRSGVTTQGSKEVEVGTLLLGNDKIFKVIFCVIFCLWALSKQNDAQETVYLR